MQIFACMVLRNNADVTKPRSVLSKSLFVPMKYSESLHVVNKTVRTRSRVALGYNTPCWVEMHGAKIQD